MDLRHFDPGFVQEPIPGLLRFCLVDIQDHNAYLPIFPFFRFSPFPSLPASSQGSDP